MSLRIIVSSTDSEKFFNNTPYFFTVQLNRQIQFDGYWVVALTEFNISNRKVGEFDDTEIFVCCDICQETFVGDKEMPLLRRIKLEKENNIVYTLPYYIPVKISQLQQLQIHIKDRQGKFVSFRDEQVTLTLHFKKFPYIL